MTGTHAALPADERSVARLADIRPATGPIRLVLVGGLPGTGKSTISAAVSRRYGWPVIRSDVIRRQLAGVTGPATAAPGRGIYRPEWTGATYCTLLDRAADHLEAGRSVLLDATWTDPMHRAAASRLARRTGAELIELECRATPERALARLARRPLGADDTSGADAEVYRYLAEHTAPWPEAIELDTNRPLPETLADAFELVSHPPTDRPLLCQDG